MDDLLNDLSKFFASLEASDRLTLGIAVVSAALSVWAIVESKRVTEKPLLIVEEIEVLSNHGPNPDIDPTAERMVGPSVKLVFANRGNGTAHDLRIVLHSPGLDKAREIARTPMLLEGGEHTETAMLSMAVHKTEPIVESQFKRHWTEYHPRIVDTSQAKIVFTWRQEPRMKKVRTMTIQLPTAAEPAWLAVQPTPAPTQA